MGKWVRIILRLRVFQCINHRARRGDRWSPLAFCFDRRSNGFFIKRCTRSGPISFNPLFFVDLSVNNSKSRATTGRPYERDGYRFKQQASALSGISGF
jgi:hypothetical protein